MKPNSKQCGENASLCIIASIDLLTFNMQKLSMLIQVLSVQKAEKTVSEISSMVSFMQIQWPAPFQPTKSVFSPECWFGMNPNFTSIKK